ncbi:MAG: hypothetical protein WC373_15095 [Smithella sp.]|jgi:hypothetical protein
MRSESGIEWTPALRRLEDEIFKSKRDRRIDNIRMAWGVYLKTLEKKSWLKKLWERLLTVL